MTLKSNKCRKGFTVLELILVTIPVAIIGISLFVGLILLIVYLIKHYI
jgi:Tfp pilus assembly protein PilE